MGKSPFASTPPFALSLSKGGLPRASRLRHPPFDRLRANGGGRVKRLKPPRHARDQLHVRRVAIETGDRRRVELPIVLRLPRQRHRGACARRVIARVLIARERRVRADRHRLAELHRRARRGAIAHVLAARVFVRQCPDRRRDGDLDRVGHIV
ncbi:hypothetical protein WR25_15589 [Diploscapter pachys]|uniref:Uncharacterized protein n=1 Tax=Diploscapter pachys TaxID=2018661 RepID=A0A2A2K8K1_9BILA|nr:hypothetical protein WR25_15589 [Diploscapter pachys]